MSEARLLTFLSNFGNIYGHFFLFVYLFEFVFLYACVFFSLIAILCHQCIIIKYFNNLLNLYIYMLVKKYLSCLNNVNSCTRNVDGKNITLSTHVFLFANEQPLIYTYIYIQLNTTGL